jgi:hypothetical protein
LVLSLGAAVFALGVAACDDDTSGDMDMSMSTDMSATADMTASVDMTMQGPSPGTGRMLLGAVQGTLYSDVGGAEVPAAPNAYVMQALVTFPEFSLPPDSIDPAFSSTPTIAGGMGVHGCIADRYTLGGSDVPQPDQPVGDVTFTGFAQAIATNGAVAPGPAPNSIVCSRSGVTMAYGCTYQGTADGGMGPLSGQSTSAVFFPAMNPIPAGTTIRIQVPMAGGGTYTNPAPATAMIGNLPDAVHIIGVQVGSGTPVTALDQIGSLDGTQNVVITYSCDGSNTVGAGCTGGSVGALDFLVIAGLTSTQPRKSFKTPGLMSPTWGQLSCFEQTNGQGRTDGAGKITIRKEEIATFVGNNTVDGGAQIGSYQIAIVRVLGVPGSASRHTVFYAAGRGNFGFNNF